MLYPEFREKFEVDEVVFTQRYVVGNQLFVCIFQKIIACLDFLSKLQEKYDVGRDWSSFYFHCFESRNKICVYEFESANLEEIRVYENFCSLAIP